MRIASAAQLRESLDSRRESRVAVQVDLSLAPAEDLADTTQTASVNLSLSGVCVRTERRYPVGQLLVLCLTVGTEYLELHGVVAWSEPQIAELGIRFVDLSDEAYSRLEAVVWLLSGLET
jgi:Tfp pilus assembly protein PilZ